MERTLHSTLTIQHQLQRTMNARFHCFSNVGLSNKPATEVQQEINFKEMLSEIVENVKYISGRNHGVEININIRNEAPFVSYRQRMEMVLYKLIANSIKNLDSGTHKPFVYIKIHSHDRGTCILIRDNCKAVKKEVLEKIFGMFDERRKHYEEFALELYIVKDTIEKLNGRIEVDAELEDATEFNIHLPNVYN